MSNEETEYRELISKLQREEQRPAALKEIRIFFGSKPPGEIANTIRNVGISKIVHCVNVPDKTQTDRACLALKACFDQLNLGDIVRYFTGHLMYMLRHEKECVRGLAIDEVYKTVTKDPTFPVPEFIDVFVAIAPLVADDSMDVASRAVSITSNLPPSAYPKVLDEMKISLEDTNASKRNAFKVIINISTKSYELFRLSVDLKYIDFMVAELESNDEYHQLNVLELLSILAVSPHGMNYLMKKEILNVSLLKELSRDPFGSLLTGYMQLFGCIAHHYPSQMFDNHPILLEIMFDALYSKGVRSSAVAMKTLGFIGETIEGKLCLAAFGGKYTQAVDNIGDIIRNSPNNMAGNSSRELKIRGLYCFASLIGIDKDPKKPKTGPVHHRVTLMTREWFRSLHTSSDAMVTLFELCKNPFPDTRLSAFTLLDAVCQHQWGKELVARTAGFIEYLLDRSVDHMKNSQEAKYQVIRRLANSTAFNVHIIMRLQAYVEQGPLSEQAQMEVAMEERELN